MTGFNFSQERPSDTFFKDIQSLNKFNLEQFDTLSALTIQLCLDPSKAHKLMGQLEEFSEQEGINFNSLKTVFKTLLSVTNSAVRLNLSDSQLKSDLINLGLEEEKAARISQQWDTNKAGLSRSALSQTLNVNQLVDMEWKFGVTAASSDLNKVGNTFLQLKLLINKGNKMETVHMELSLNQFYSFLHEMEKAKTSLEYFS